MRNHKIGTFEKDGDLPLGSWVTFVERDGKEHAKACGPREEWHGVVVQENGDKVVVSFNASQAKKRGLI